MDHAPFEFDISKSERQMRGHERVNHVGRRRIGESRRAVGESYVADATAGHFQNPPLVAQGTSIAKNRIKPEGEER